MPEVVVLPQVVRGGETELVELRHAVGAHLVHVVIHQKAVHAPHDPGEDGAVAIGHGLTRALEEGGDILI